MGRPEALNSYSRLGSYTYARRLGLTLIPDLDVSAPHTQDTCHDRLPHRTLRVSQNTVQSVVVRATVTKAPLFWHLHHTG